MRVVCVFAGDDTNKVRYTFQGPSSLLEELDALLSYEDIANEQTVPLSVLEGLRPNSPDSDEPEITQSPRSPAEKEFKDYTDDEVKERCGKYRYRCCCGEDNTMVFAQCPCMEEEDIFCTTCGSNGDSCALLCGRFNQFK